MKKKLIIKQDGFKDCGAACLLSIIRYYGGDIAKGRLIELVKTTKDGTSFYNISLAASHLGFAAKGFKVDEIDKIKEVNLPFISQVNKNGYMHFVVVYKINNNKILIMNPSTGKEVIDIFDFSNMWTGYILLLEKVSELPVYKSNKIIKKIIFKVLNDNKSNIIIVFILSVIFTLLSCIVGLYSQIVFDKVIDTELHNLKLITIVFFILYIIKNITSFIRNHLLIYLNQKLDVTLLIESFCKVILLPFNYYKNKKASEVLSRINDLSYIKSFISKIIVTILLDILLFIISFIIIFNINKDILILYLVGAFLYFLIIIIYNTIIKNTIITKQERVVEVNNTIIESVNGFETIKGLNIEDNITVSTYIKNHKQSKNIEIDFKNEGVYISRNVADMIKKSINISKDDELKGVYLTFDISVPLYNTHGRWMGITDDEESMYIYSVTVTHESVSLPIAGILNWSSFGLNNTYSNSLYVERDIVENMIEKHKKTEDRKLYVIGVNYDKYYENELPKDFDGEVNRVFEDSVWQPTALSVYVDGSENVYTVAQKLSDMGYYVDNESIDSEAINRGIVSLMNVFYYGSFIISAIIVIYAASILFVQRKQNARINEYFKQLGLSEFDILKIRKHYYLLNVFHEFKKLMLILIVLFGLRSIKIHALFFPNIISIILAIVLHMICHYILPQLFDKLKND